MKFLTALFLVALLHAVAAQRCAEPTKVVTIEITDATVGTAFPTQRLNRGDTIRWINRRDSNIVIASTDSPRVFESPPVAKDASYTYTFNQPGSFNYWLLFELNSISSVTVADCTPFTNTVSPSPTRVNSVSPSPSTAASRSPTPSPVSPSPSTSRGPPSPSPSSFDICEKNAPTEEIPIPPGGGVQIFRDGNDNDFIQLAPGQTVGVSFQPVATEDVRLTVFAQGAIDFVVSNSRAEPWANPVCGWSTTNCLLSSQEFTLRCRTPYIQFRENTLPPRITWWAYVRNRTDRSIRVSARFLNVLREQKNPVVNNLSFDGMAGTEPITLQ